MVLSNQMRSSLDAGGGAREAASVLTQMLAPLAPFAAEELWRVELGHPESVHRSAWPTYDPDLAREDRVTLVLQVDGKVRDRVEVDADASEEACRALALASEGVHRAVGDRPVAQLVVRPPRLVNVVTGG
jgi:leucyl-tRNA synthetase